MGVSVEQFVKKMSAEFEKTLRFFNELPNIVWDNRLYSDGEEWTVHQVLGHIVEAEGSFFHLFSNIAAGGSGVGPDFDLDKHNADEVRLISTKSRETLFTLFRERRARMLELVEGLSDEALNNIGNHPYLGEARLQEMLRLYILHVNLHIRDIRKSLGERKE